MASPAGDGDGNVLFSSQQNHLSSASFKNTVKDILTNDTVPNDCAQGNIQVNGILVYWTRLSSSWAMGTLQLVPSPSSPPPPTAAAAKAKDKEDVSDEFKHAQEYVDFMLKAKDGWPKEQMDAVDHALVEHVVLETSNVGGTATAIADSDLIGNATTSMSSSSCSRICVTGYTEVLKTSSTKEEESSSICFSSAVAIHALQIQIAESMTFDAQVKSNNTAAPSTSMETNDNDKTKNSHFDYQQKSKNNNGHTGANDISRFSRLTSFLIDLLGVEALRARPVLDIAGGAGGFAFECMVRHDIPCVVVDTQMVKLSGPQKRHLKFRQACWEGLQDAPKYSPLAQVLKNRFRPRSYQVKQFATLLDDSWVLGQQKNNENGNDGKATVDENTTRLTEDQRKLRDMLQNRDCSVLVGLHPDQGLDPIVEIGLALQIPWVVVPCCVFPRLFNQRRLTCGRAVRSYDDLCEYLLQRHPAVREVRLPFRGRNRAFSWLPKHSRENVVKKGNPSTNKEY